MSKAALVLTRGQRRGPNKRNAPIKQGVNKVLESQGGDQTTHSHEHGASVCLGEHGWTEDAGPNRFATDN